MKKPLCIARTKKGKPCPIHAQGYSGLCHIHDPNGVYQIQQREKAARG